MTTDNPTKNATIRQATEQVISDAKYILVHFTVWDYNRETKTVNNVYIIGVSSQKEYDRVFKEWNDGFNSFADSIKVNDDNVTIDYLGNEYTVTGIKSVLNLTTKNKNRCAKTDNWDLLSVSTY